MAHAQTPDFVFRGKGRVHLKRRGRQFSRLLAGEVFASAVVMLDTPSSEVVLEYWLPTPFASFPFISPPVRHRVPSHFKRTLTRRSIRFFATRTTRTSYYYCYFNFYFLLSQQSGRRVGCFSFKVGPTHEV